MPVDSVPQPCPHCVRPIVLTTRGSGRRWVHVGTWRQHCGEPTWMTHEATAVAVG